MARETVVKVEILCHHAHRSDVLAILERSGMVHLAGIDSTGIPGFDRVIPDSVEELRELRLKLDRAIQFLSEFLEGKSPTELTVTRDALERVLGDQSLRKATEQASSLSVEITETVQTIRDLEARRRFLDQWSFLPWRFDLVGRQGAFTVFAGSIPDAPAAAAVLSSEFEASGVFPHGGDKIVCVAHADQAVGIGERLSSLGFVPGDFAGLAAEPAEEVLNLDSALDECRVRLARLEDESRLLAGSLPEFRMLYDAVGLAATRHEMASGGLSSASVLVMRAWMRKDDVQRLRGELENLAAAGIDEIQPEPDETPPVFLSESATVDPYLLLTDMFGRPAGADPDPTPLFAPFYALFFGICIGDAGYGAALLLGSAFGIWLTKRRGGNSRLFKLIFHGGIASIIAGVLLGGWFGIEFNSLPGFLQAPAMLLNGLVPGYVPGKPGFSVSNQFLYLTLALGLVQLAWGVIVNLPKRLRQGEGFAAVLEQGGWMLAIIGLFPWLFNRYLLNGALYDISGPADKAFLILLAAGAILIFIMGGRSAASIGGKVGLGAYAAYGIVNLLGDVLSYSRLFALALSSAIIAQVINEIAGMLAGSIAGVGIVLAILVLVAGHVFNLAMAVLSGFIHTARLQFVEFFGKFYDGTGVPFAPLRYQPRFVRIGDVSQLKLKPE
ncbi:MAG: V-type ATP synthase subunit I [Candidatus Fermentibacteraceae bacterium]